VGLEGKVIQGMAFALYGGRAAWDRAGKFIPDLDAGTLAYLLATNAVGRTNGFTPSDMVEVSGWTPAIYTAANMNLLTNSTWATNFWLKGVQGLSATPIGISNNPWGQTLVTMVSPRHYLRAHHVGGPYGIMAFLGTNNVIYWRAYVQQVQVQGDTDVGIVDADLPSSVGFLPVGPTNLSNYLPTNSTSIIQGIGMNQYMKRFSQPMSFADPFSVNWNPAATIPFGVSANWSVGLIPGDSSDPECLLINNQLVLVSHNSAPFSGPSYAWQFGLINQYMHYLSTNNNLVTDYQLTAFSLTNWPVINH